MMRLLRVCIAAWLWAVLWPLAFAQIPATALQTLPGVVAILDKSRIALGEPVTLTLRRPASQAPGLDTLDLQALRADFDIATRSLGRDASTEDLRLTLYPLRAGALTLPRFAPRGQPLTLQVDDGPVDGVTSAEPAPRVRVRVFSEPDSAAGWVVRQPVRLTLEACFTGQLLWKPPTLASRNGLSVRLLGDRSEAGEIDGQPCTAQRWQWAVVPQVAGPLRLTWPLLQATRFGNEWRFPAPAVEAVARALPGWLPGELPLREPQVLVQRLPNEASLRDPLAWELEIEGDYGDGTLAELLRAQLAGDVVWSAYPPEVRPAPERGLSPRWSVRLLAQPQDTGPLQPPTLRLPWVDPQAGRPSQALQQVAVYAEVVEISDPQAGAVWRWLIGTLTVLLAAGAALRSAWRLRCGWRRYQRASREHARLLDAIERSTGALELHHALAGLAGGDTSGATLFELLVRVQTRWRGPSLVDWATRFERLRFGAGADAEMDFESLRLELSHLTRAMRPRPSMSNR